MPIFVAPGIHWTFNGKTVHTLPDDPDLIGKKKDVSTQSNSAMNFIDKYSALGLGITSTLTIENFDKDLEGVYSCRNEVHSDEVSNEVLCPILKPCHILFFKFSMFCSAGQGAVDRRLSVEQLGTLV